MSEQNMSSEIAALRSKVNVLEEELALANQQLEWFRKQVFGRKTEQTKVVMECAEQLSMFGSIEEKTEPEKITVPAHERKKKRSHEDWMSSLPVEVIDHTLDNPVCDICGSEMKDIGEEKAYDELVLEPAKYHIRRHMAHKYKCPECG